jgi:hypothetical protein
MSYNGWRNWDTWNCHLWLSNKDGAYRTMRAWSRSGVPLDAFIAVATGGLEAMGNPDCIDYGKVDWEEVRQAFAEE